MALESLVLIDTCLWVSFFNRPHSAERKQIDELLDDDRVAIIGPILGEVLQGSGVTTRRTGLPRR